jgi:TPR repeat protein
MRLGTKTLGTWGFMRAIVAIGFAVFAAGALPPFSLPPANSQPLDDVATTCERYVRGNVNADLAIQACESAVRKYPNSIRLIYQLGWAYENKKDFRSALIQYRKAAGQGYAEAQLSLGLMYDKGRGVPQNYSEASKWLRKAAEQGNFLAQFTLAVNYYTGDGVPQDYGEALKWLRKAAEHGDGYSQLYLGQMYERGQGVPQNYVQAHMWMNLAATLGSTGVRDEAIKHRNRLASLMSPAQTAEAQRLARICLQSNYKECGVDRQRIARRDKGA